MKATLAALLMAAVLAACGPRQVDMTPDPDVGPEVALHMTNNHTQAVNVYVIHEGDEILAGQVPANSTQHLPIRGVPSGSRVSLRARSTDGTRTWSTPSPVTLVGTYSWQVP